MKSSSYLIVLDGSAESLAAAHCAWSLAAETGSRVDAQYVIDTESIWRFLSWERPGFVGSGVFIEASDKIKAVMQHVAETVVLSYRTQMEGRCLEFETYIDSGCPVEQIVARAAGRDLVIVGYHSPKRPGDVSLAELVAARSPCPVIAVRGLAYGWSKMEVFLGKDMANETAVKEIYALAAWMGMGAEVVLSPEVKDMDPQTYMMGGWSRAFGVEAVRSGKLGDLVSTAADDALMVVGAEQLEARDGHGSEAVREFLEGSERRAILFWPAPVNSGKTLASAAG